MKVASCAAVHDLVAIMVESLSIIYRIVDLMNCLWFGATVGSRRRSSLEED